MLGGVTSANINIMNRIISPDAIAAPAANYAHAILTTDAASWLHASGAVGTLPDGTVPDSIDAQVDAIWVNLLAIVAEAGMTADDIVSITTYVVAEFIDSLGIVMAARDRRLGGRRVASTLVAVPALARPHWKVEFALVAAH